MLRNRDFLANIKHALKTAEQSNGKANDSKTESTEYYEVKRGETLAKISLGSAIVCPSVNTEYVKSFVCLRAVKE
jgi:hypothetical protein